MVESGIVHDAQLRFYFTFCGGDLLVRDFTLNLVCVQLTFTWCRYSMITQEDKTYE